MSTERSYPPAAEAEDHDGTGGGSVPPVPASSVTDALGATSSTILEGHLTWLVARTRREPQLSPQRVLFEDLSRVLIDALEQRGEHEVLTTVMTASWIPEDLPDADEALEAYASNLEGATAGQPGHSPFVALAQSARRFSAETVHCRGAQPSSRFA